MHEICFYVGVRGISIVLKSLLLLGIAGQNWTGPGPVLDAPWPKVSVRKSLAPVIISQTLLFLCKLEIRRLVKSSRFSGKRRRCELHSGKISSLSSKSSRRYRQNNQPYFLDTIFKIALFSLCRHMSGSFRTQSSIGSHHVRRLCSVACWGSAYCYSICRPHVSFTLFRSEKAFKFEHEKLQKLCTSLSVWQTAPQERTEW